MSKKTSKRRSSHVPAAPEVPPAPAALGSVHLHYRAPEAQTVFVAGSFNAWQPDVTPMNPSSDGFWSIVLELPPSDYEYRFVVDGNWCSDPDATDSVANPFGTLNEVLRVPPPV